MKYRDGYLYQLAEGEKIRTPFRPPEDIETEFISLSKSGLMYLESGYACDGPSGPIKAIAQTLGAIPFAGKWLKKKYLEKVFVPAVAHDAIYQLLRQGYLPPSDRIVADEMLWAMCLARGMMEIRANAIYKGVRIGAGYAADPKNKKIVYEVA